MFPSINNAVCLSPVPEIFLSVGHMHSSGRIWHAKAQFHFVFKTKTEQSVALQESSEIL